MFNRTMHRWLEPSEWAWDHLEETAKSEFENLEVKREAIGEENACAVRSFSVACNVDYLESFELLQRFGRIPKNGTNTFQVVLPAIESLGLKVEILKNIKGRTIRTFAACNKSGRFVVVTREHSVGIVNGNVIDWAEKSLLRILYVFKLQLPEWFEELERKVPTGFKLRLSVLAGLACLYCGEDKVFEGCPEALTTWLEKDYTQLSAEANFIGSELEILKAWFETYCPLRKCT